MLPRAIAAALPSTLGPQKCGKINELNHSQWSLRFHRLVCHLRAQCGAQSLRRPSASTTWRSCASAWRRQPGTQGKAGGGQQQQLLRPTPPPLERQPAAAVVEEAAGRSKAAGCCNPSPKRQRQSRSRTPPATHRCAGRGGEGSEESEAILTRRASSPPPRVFYRQRASLQNPWAPYSPLREVAMTCPRQRSRKRCLPAVSESLSECAHTNARMIAR